MGFRIFSGILGAVLLVAFIGPVVVKLKEVSLIVVAGIGTTMMLIDVWQSLRTKDD